MTTTRFNLQLSELGSAALLPAYGGVDMKCGLFSDNDQSEPDALIRLYEVEDGSFFALSNGDPIWQEEFCNHGYCRIEDAAKAICHESIFRIA